jgi:hypothetical protein
MSADQSIYLLVLYHDHAGVGSGPVSGARETDTTGSSLRALLTGATTREWFTSDPELSTSLAGVAQAGRIGLGLVRDAPAAALASYQLALGRKTDLVSFLIHLTHASLLGSGTQRILSLRQPSQVVRRTTALHTDSIDGGRLALDSQLTAALADAAEDCCRLMPMVLELGTDSRG